LEDWGDFDQFDFKAPWYPREYYDIVKDFRAGMPWNSGCEFDEWCGFYDGILERLEETLRHKKNMYGALGTKSIGNILEGLRDEEDRM
ncbi:MAG: hypothetical protein PHU34_04375, partial [Candidatus Methanoperedens sp.]|nr:hypothetical protein [Candidatus Methanoperedens sp.]